MVVPGPRASKENRVKEAELFDTISGVDVLGVGKAIDVLEDLPSSSSSFTSTSLEGTKRLDHTMK